MDSDHILEVVSLPPLSPGLESGFKVVGEAVFEDTGVDEHCADNVGVDVGGWASVLDVALSLSMHDGRWDAERGSSVTDTEGELVHG